MKFLNLGEKDEYGRQKRIEHRGKYLRASRTGGLSLRAQTRAAGLNLTANATHGFRVSRTVGKKTQMAMQNGRFVLRGRYGSGPTKLNLSKSGMTVSTRNELGTFNWVKPNRSSAKLLGVQVRGKNAVYAHIAYVVVTAIVACIQLMLALILTLAQWAWQILKIALKLALAAPYGLVVLQRRFRNWQVRKAQTQLSPAFIETLETWSEDQIVAATALAFLAWGRGFDLQLALQPLKEALDGSNKLAELTSSQPDLEDVSVRMSEWYGGDADLGGPLPVLARTATLAEMAARRVSGDRLPKLLLGIDDAALQQAPKTRLQEQMLTVFCDFSGLRLESDS